MTPRRRRAARSEQLLRISRRMDSLEGRFAAAPASDHPGAPTPAKDHTGGGGGTQRAPAPARAPAAAEDGPGGGREGSESVSESQRIKRRLLKEVRAALRARRERRGSSGAGRCAFEGHGCQAPARKPGRS